MFSLSRKPSDPLDHWPKIRGKFVCDDVHPKPEKARGDWHHYGAVLVKKYSLNSEFKCIFCRERWISINPVWERSDVH